MIMQINTVPKGKDVDNRGYQYTSSIQNVSVQTRRPFKTL